ncbi:putative ribonuclease H-like domain-containing protein [Tanacetum coccineum]
MNCFEKIAKDAKVIEIDNQLLVLIKRQVETKLMLEVKFRDLCEEVSNFVKEIEDVVKEVERLSCKDVAKETVCLLRHGQKRELYMMTRLQMMVDESYLSVREKHTFVTLIVGASPSCDVQLPCKKRRKIRNLDPPAGIFANHFRSLFECDFVSLDLRLNSKKSTMDHSFGFAEEVDHVRILQSCNGLLLLHKGRNFLESFGEPSDDPILLLMKIPHMLHLEGKFFFLYAEMILALQRWSIRIGVWSICLGEGEEDAFVVINLSRKVVKYNLTSKTNTKIFDIRSNQMDDDDVAAADDDDAVLFILPFEVDPNLYEFTPSLASGNFFESCGCLLLVYRDDIGSTEFTIYEMMKGSFVWPVRYLVNIVQLPNPLPEGWSIRTGVWSICLGEGGEDAFVVINLSGKVVKYNLTSKTNTEIFDIGSNQMDDDDAAADDDDDDAVLFIPSFEVDPNLYEFISSLASVMDIQENDKNRSQNDKIEHENRKSVKEKSSQSQNPISTTRIHKDHPVEQIIGDIHSAPQTRRMTKHVTNHVQPKKGYTQEKEIDYDEVFAPVTRIEAVRLFLAYALFKDFVVYQIDVKSAFLYGKIEEEVYVCQPLGFEDPEFPDRVYKVEKALYGLHQAPRAWYETLSTYLLDNGFQRGQIDKTLFIKRVKGDILLVQVYVDDIIFGSTRKEMCTEFEKMMHKKFQMSSMGELTFFLGLQVTQKDDGIFISQDKYVDEILKKFGFSTVKTASTPMETSKPLLKDAEAEDVDVHLYRSMIGSLMYLTASRPDIMFVVCACARFQVTPKVSHLYVVKRIFRYLKGQPKLVVGLRKF